MAKGDVLELVDSHMLFPREEDFETGVQPLFPKEEAREPSDEIIHQNEMEFTFENKWTSGPLKQFGQSPTASGL